MSQVVRYNGLGLTYNTKIIPGRVGRGDIGWPTDVDTYPVNGAIGTGVHIGYAGTDPFLDMIMVPFNQCSIAWELTSTPNVAFTTRTTYSISFIMTFTADPPFQYNHTFFRLYNGTSVVGGLMMQGGVAFDWAGAEVRKLLLLGPGGAGQGGWSSWRPSTNVPAKFEIEVDNGANPKYKVRVYEESGGAWVLRASMSANPSGSMAATSFGFGLFRDQKDTALQNLKLKQVNAWDTSNADGKFPNYVWTYPSVTASQWNGTTEDPVEISGKWNGTAVQEIKTAMDTPQRAFGGFRAGRHIVPPTYFSSPGAVSYGPDGNESYLLYYPTDRPMPVGGWPLMMWGVTQYFISGDANSLYTTNPDMLYHLLHNGFAVCSFAVKNADAIDPVSTGPVFVRQTVGAKLATRHVLANNASILNANKVITGGHSAGGFIAGNAATTRNFNDTLYGRNFTLAGNGFGGVDPTYRGVLLFDPPVNLERCRADDPTHPNWALENISSTVGKIPTVTALLMGYQVGDFPSLAGVNMADLVTRNSAVVPPIRYHVGTSDTVIIPDQELELRTACAAAGVPYTYFVETGVTHEGSPLEFSKSFMPWMHSVTA